MMLASTFIDLRRLPANPAEAEMEITVAIKRLFVLARESDMTSVHDFSVVREFGIGDPFASHMQLTLRFDGDPSKTILTAYGNTRNE